MLLYFIDISSILISVFPFVYTKQRYFPSEPYIELVESSLVGIIKQSIHITVTTTCYSKVIV